MQSNYRLPDILAFARANYAPGKQFRFTPMVYPVTFGALVASHNVTRPLAISAAADFLLMGFSWDDASPATKMYGSALMVTDSASGDQLTQRPMRLPALACQGVNGFTSLYYPKLFPARSALSLQLTGNGTDDTATNFVLSAHGINIQVY